MKTIFRHLTIIIFFICGVIQTTFSCCYPNDSKKCIKSRFRCATTSLLEATCCVLSKQLFAPTESLSKKDYCLAMWFPSSSHCNNTTGVIYQWSTTGCVFLAGLQSIASFMPCIQENYCKKVRRNCFCCCPEKLFFCSEFVEKVSPDGTLN